MTRASRLALLSLSATLAAVLLAMTIVEVAVRASWDPRRGTPGLFIADARRSQRLAPGYNGWFAGVPVRINNLGFRDTRDYSLAKTPQTFRILVLGDSVTFGHGATFETTYPALLRERLARWRPETDWQVWNLGVPGYNTGQELSQLQELGPAFRPDLVIVGFFENDLDGNETNDRPGAAARSMTAARNLFESRMYSLQLYKRLFLTAAWKISGRDAFHERLDNLANIESFLAPQGSVDGRLHQLTPLARRASGPDPCPPGVETESDRQAGLLIGELQTIHRWDGWTNAVNGLAALNRSGRYRIVFFLNMAPDVNEKDDLFCDGGSRRLNDYFVSTIGAQMPIVSAYDEIGRYRPSEMLLAKGHSVGNTNRIKADVLFEYLQAHAIR